jgi:hypothetical protein
MIPSPGATLALPDSASQASTGGTMIREPQSKKVCDA